MPHLELDGTAGGYVLLPYRPEYNATNIVDLRVEIDYDAYATNQALVNRWTGSSGASVWQFYLGAGGLRGIVEVRDSTATLEAAVASTNFTLTPGTRAQLRSTIDTTAGECKFFARATGTALSVDTGWSQVGTTRPLTVTDLQEPTETGIKFGASGTGSTHNAAGKMYGGVVKKGAGVEIVNVPFENTAAWVFA